MIKYQCNKCQSSFNNDYDLYDHIRIVHRSSNFPNQSRIMQKLILIYRPNTSERMELLKTLETLIQGIGFDYINHMFRVKDGSSETMWGIGDNGSIVGYDADKKTEI